jgi:hypothetical protein
MLYNGRKIENGIVLNILVNIRYKSSYHVDVPQSLIITTIIIIMYFYFCVSL